MFLSLRWLPGVPILLLMVVMCGCAQRSQPTRMWNASMIADHAQDVAVIKLYGDSRHTKGKKKRENSVVATVNTADVRNLIRIKEQVESAVGELRAELLIAEGNEPNGFAFSRTAEQYIAINIGMINLLRQDEDAIAALIGHELAHLYLAHSKQRQDREYGRGITTTVIAFALGVVGVPYGVVDYATGTIAKSYSREEERDADRLAVTFMSQAGFDPWGAVRLTEKLATVPGTSKIPFLSTHPSTKERIENLRRQVQESQ